MLPPQSHNPTQFGTSIARCREDYLALLSGCASCIRPQRTPAPLSAFERVLALGTFRTRAPAPVASREVQSCRGLCRFGSAVSCARSSQSAEASSLLWGLGSHEHVRVTVLATGSACSFKETTRATRASRQTSALNPRSRKPKPRAIANPRGLGIRRGPVDLCEFSASAEQVLLHPLLGRRGMVIHSSGIPKSRLPSCTSQSVERLGG